MRKKSRSSAGVAFLEFAIVAPIVFLLTMGTIDLFLYLYLSNILESQAQQALEVATWVPGLEKPEHDKEGKSNPDFENALKEIYKVAKETGSSRLIIGYSENHGFDFVTLREDNAADKEKFEKARAPVVVAVRALGPTGTREEQLAKMPISVKINAKMQPLTPFLPAISISKEAWGYRESRISNTRGPLLDCTGKVFDPNNLPTVGTGSGQCDCESINVLNGKCGCPPGKIYGRLPGTNIWQCICDFNQIRDENGKFCTDSQLIDYVNCRCDSTCNLGDAKGYGLRRIDSKNVCGCEEVKVGTQTETCKNSQTMVDGVLEKEAIASGCGPSNCPPGHFFYKDACGCWCPRKNATWDGTAYFDRSGMLTQDKTLEPVWPLKACNYECSGEIVDKDKYYSVGDDGCKCRLKENGLNTGPPEALIDVNGYVLDRQTCTYKCNASIYWEGNNQGFGQKTLKEGKCQCDVGYVDVRDAYYTNDPSFSINGDKPACCLATSCGPNEYIYVGNDASQARACLCECKSGYTRIEGVCTLVNGNTNEEDDVTVTK